jgi:hypothetical protein
VVAHLVSYVRRRIRSPVPNVLKLQSQVPPARSANQRSSTELKLRFELSAEASLQEPPFFLWKAAPPTDLVRWRRVLWQLAH